MVERSHFGPLRVQKPLYPDGKECCHAIIVHPPGGVVGGDELAISASVGDKANTFITTPGAAKWYKANKRVARQDVRLDVGAGAALEWMPQETIFFNAAEVRLNHCVSLGKDASYIGCEILCFGRTASGESFDTGRIEQLTEIRREGRLIWFEQGVLAGGSPAMASPLSLASKTVCATLIATGKSLPATIVNAIREEAAAIADPADLCGVTQMKSVLSVRFLGNSGEIARALMTRAWQQIRPALLGRAAVVPRIWKT